MGAAAVVFDEEGRVLLVKENYGKHRWSLPGGAIEAGETPEEAAVREANERNGRRRRG
jgi:8-oxo-dGTP diphosphatase